MIHAPLLELGRVMTLSFIFRNVPGAGELPAIVVGGAKIWGPPTRAIIVDGYAAWDDQADPLVGAGGATQAGLNARGVGGSNMWDWLPLASGQIVAIWNPLFYYPGAGNRYHAIYPMKELQVLSPSGWLPGTSAARAERYIAAACDAGTVTGTMWLRMWYRYFDDVNPAEGEP